MIAPEFRTTENITLTIGCKNFIGYNYGKIAKTNFFEGDAMWKDLEADVSGVEVLHNNLVGVNNHKTDANQLKKYKDMFL